MELSLEDLALIQAHKNLKPSTFRRFIKNERPDPNLELFEPTSKILEHIGRASIRLIGPSTPIWSPNLNQLKSPPVLLYTQGIPLDKNPVLGIVGSRSECPYSHRITQAIVAKWNQIHPQGRIVSGGGLGVDSAAWKASLELNMAPIMVLAHGLGNPHINHLSELYKRTKEQGTLISEALPFSKPIARMFPDRNRLIAALSDVLVVVRAARRSGSLHTLNLALKLGKKVFCVVGHLDDPGWFGIHDALRTKKVHPLFSLDELAPKTSKNTSENKYIHPPHTSLQEQRILGALNQNSLAIEELAGILGLTAAPTMRLLAPLEIRGLISKNCSGRFQISSLFPVRN